MKKSILALSVLLATQTTMAQEITPIGKIGNVASYASSSLINLQTPHNNSDGCSHALATSHAVITGENKAMFSVVLSAFVSGKNVRLICDGCIGGIPLVSRVDIMN